VVHEGNIQERDGAKLVLLKARKKGLPRLQKIWADAGYAGILFIAWVLTWLNCVLEIVKRPRPGEFTILPFRWIVERTFGWLNTKRRLSKDYEFSVKSSESWIYLGMLHKMLRQIAA